jgi:hypothetical protein
MWGLLYVWQHHCSTFASSIIIGKLTSACSSRVVTCIVLLNSCVKVPKSLGHFGTSCCCWLGPDALVERYSNAKFSKAVNPSVHASRAQMRSCCFHSFCCPNGPCCTHVLQQAQSHATLQRSRQRLHTAQAMLTLVTTLLLLPVSDRTTPTTSLPLLLHLAA